jgi:hypothetical protein
LVAVKRYVVVAVSVTDWAPVVETVPIPGVIVTPVAFITSQCNVTDDPEATVTGEA